MADGSPGHSADDQVRGLIAEARQLAMRGRRGEADRILGKVEAQAPRHPLVLNELASRMIGAGNHDAAAGLLEQAVKGEPRNPEIWFNFAVALRALDRLDDARNAFDMVVRLNPKSTRAWLEKGAVEEARGKTRDAAMSYRQALLLVPPGSRTPPGLERSLRRAKETLDANNLALENHLASGLGEIRKRFPDASFRRFDQCVETMLQKRRIYRQQPTFMYFPEMPAIEFYDRAMFPWLEQVEAAAGDIRAELLEVLSGGAETLDPYITVPEGAPSERWGALTNSRRWGVYYLWNEGETFPGHMARCPKTVKALEGLPHWDVPGSGPTAMFSILDAGSRIPPHTGPVNTRLVVHLQLVVPPGCGFRVGGQQREWVPGEAFVFDDSIEHEAWNNSDQSRAVLIFNVWSPFLDEAERELVRALTASIGEYYGVGAYADHEPARIRTA
ncbi:MAG: aspartyl/asparaginyl beta-hydroxylase domain-containing protein [Caulobacteraceae bacterium]